MEIKTVCSIILLKLAANSLQHISDKWVEHCKKCITCPGRYLKKKTVTTPPQSSNPEYYVSTNFSNGPHILMKKELADPDEILIIRQI
jgi:hypothetical protein